MSSWKLVEAEPEVVPAASSQSAQGGQGRGFRGGATRGSGYRNQNFQQGSPNIH
jgi:hypothetical protein